MKSGKRRNRETNGPGGEEAVHWKRRLIAVMAGVAAGTVLFGGAFDNGISSRAD